MGAGASVSTVFCHSCGNRSRGVTACQSCGSTVVEQTDGRFPVADGENAMVATVESITVVADSVDEDNGLLLRVAQRLVYRPVPEEDEAPISPAAKSLVDHLAVTPYIGDSTSEEMCVICSNVLQNDVESITLPCSHTYHNTCIKTWLEAQHTCPTCRFELEVDDGTYLRSIGLCEQASMIDADKMREAKICAENEAEERTRWWRAMCRGLPVHFGVQCAICKQSPVVGTTYHCCLCESSNTVHLCEDCYGLDVPNCDDSHEGEHLFLPRRLPTADDQEENSTEGAAYLAVRSLASAPLHSQQIPRT